MHMHVPLRLGPDEVSDFLLCFFTFILHLHGMGNRGVRVDLGMGNFISCHC